MNLKRGSCLLLTGLLHVFLAVSSPSQNLPAGVYSILPPLLGGLRGFSAQANITIKQPDLTGPMETTMELKYLRGKMRADINMNQVQSAELSPQMIASLQEKGMDRVTTITDPDATHTLILYPALKAYIHAPPLDKNQPDVSLKKTKLGEKFMGGHLCHHYKVTLSPSLNAPSPMNIEVWQAVDLGNFPLQIQISQKQSVVTVRFINPNLTLPSITDFQAPPNFTHYATMEKVMENAAQQLLKPPGSPAAKE